MNGNHFDIHDLKREYEKGRKQELEDMWTFISDQPLNITGHNFEKNWVSIKRRVIRRLKELEK